MNWLFTVNIWCPKFYLRIHQPLTCPRIPSSASQKIPHILWNPAVCYHMHKSLALVPIPSQSTQSVPSYSISWKIHFNIILPPMPISSKCSFHVVSPPQPCMHLSSPLQVPPISFLIWSSEHMVRSSHHSVPHYTVPHMSSPLLISFMCTISLGLSNLFFVFLTIIQIHHFFHFQRHRTMGLQHILFSLYVFLFKPKNFHPGGSFQL